MAADTTTSRPSLRVSVVIPAYACEATIDKSIESVLAQTYSPWEIIVVDDGSPRQLSSQVARFGPKIRYIRQSNGGASRARNRGIQLASGDLVAFLDSDDTWAPTKLAESVKIFDGDPNIQLVASRYKLQDASSGDGRICGPGLADCERPIQANPTAAFYLARNISTTTVIIRRASLDQHLFDATLMTAEDRDLWLRLLLAGKAYVLAQPLATVLMREDSLSHRDIDVDSKCMLRVLNRYADRIGFLATRRERAYIQYKWATGYGVGPEAWSHVLQSWREWPLPLSRRRTPCHLARPRFLLGLCYREWLARRLLWREVA